MSADGYSVDVWVGDWRSTFDQGDDAADMLADAGALALAGLRVGWDSDPEAFPAGEPPHQLALGIHVPYSSPTKPAVFQGQTVSVTITDPGWTPASDLPPFVEFHGRITDADAIGLRDGLAYSITATDHRAALAEETITQAFPSREGSFGVDVDVIRGVPVTSGGTVNPDNPPNPASTDWGRLLRIFAASELPFTWTYLGDGGGTDLLTSVTNFAAHDGAPTSTADLVSTALLTTAQRDENESFVSGHLPLATRVPCIVQEIVPDPVTDRPTLDRYRVAWTHSSPFLTSDPLPYVLASPAPPLVVRQLRTDLDSWAPCGFVLPGDVVDRALSWRQDKAAHPTRLVIDAPMFVEFPATVGAEPTTPQLASYTLARPEQEAVRGVVARSVALPIYDINDAEPVAAALLGNDFDAVPRWSVDTVTFHPAELGAGVSWPRMFNPSQPPAGREWLDGPHALGRLVLLTGINPPWNPNAGDVPGRLIGATVEIRPRGRVVCTARVRHTIPFPNHGAVNAADLTAAGMGARVPANFGTLTAHDLWLTDAPI